MVCGGCGGCQTMWWMPNQAQDSRKAVGALAARVCSCLLQLSSCLYSYLRALRERDIKSRDPDRTRGPERAPAASVRGLWLAPRRGDQTCILLEVKSAPYVLPAGCPITRFGDISFDCVLSPQQVRRTSALRIGSCSRAGYII